MCVGLWKKVEFPGTYFSSKINVIHTEMPEYLFLLHKINVFSSCQLDGALAHILSSKIHE